jgi:hypothetical protein
MIVKIVYSKQDLAATVNFITMHNPNFKGQPDYIKNSIIKTCHDLAEQFGDSDVMFWGGTMGYIVSGEIMEEESIDGDQNVIYYHFLVDPALGNNHNMSDEELVNDSSEELITINKG